VPCRAPQTYRAIQAHDERAPTPAATYFNLTPAARKQLQAEWKVNSLEYASYQAIDECVRVRGACGSWGRRAQARAL
jgi:hypothetical protein